MKRGVGLGESSNSVSTLFSRLTLHASGRNAAQCLLRACKERDERRCIRNSVTPKYVAYTDLTGSGYFPTNIPARRPAAVGRPTGLVFTKPKGQPAIAATFTATDHATAQSQFDALPSPKSNAPWLQAHAWGERLVGGKS